MTPLLDCPRAGQGSERPMMGDWLGWEPGSVGTLETDSLLGHRDGLWLCLLTHLPKATGSPCPFNSGDFRRLGPFFLCQEKWGALLSSSQCTGGVEQSQAQSRLAHPSSLVLVASSTTASGKSERTHSASSALCVPCEYPEGLGAGFYHVHAFAHMYMT